jgi:flagellar biosynthesis protein FlhF
MIVTPNGLWKRRRDAVGPAGMGKTTTLAKLAARYVLKYGAQNIALVSMDSFRIGAQEQLKTLGGISMCR